MTLQEAYLKMQQSCGINTGDTVKVLRKAKSYECGWDTSWTSGMNTWVGKTGEITEIDYQYGVKLNNQYCFPWFVLEKIKSAVKEMTVAEISKELGYEVKIIKEKN